ncbi:MAG: type pilus assembly protein PilC [Pseudomonadota bacterium]|nr:type pilus assembly protein PilC [Pseudomonadota bacterium]
MATTFKYKAVDSQGQMRSDIIEAENALDLEQRLTGMGLDLITCKPVRGVARIKFSRSGITRQDIINFAFQMEQLTRAGVPILEGLTDLRDSTTHARFKAIIAAVLDEIQGGKTLSQALAVHSSVFDNVFVTLVKVGEESGRLPDVLHDLAETLKWQDELISHTQKVMIYPALVGTVVLAVVTFLMWYLVPQLIPFIREMGGDIPWYTLALIATSDFVVAYWYLLFSLPVVAYFAIKLAARNDPKIRLQVDGLKLRVWLFGPLLLKIKLARFANYMAMMYASGITVLESLRIGRELVDNTKLSQAIQTVIDKIADGGSISDSFKSVALFPPLVIRMIRIGENTGGLDTALRNISYFYNREVKEAIEKLEPAIGPAMTVVLGGIMGWIMASVLLPIYDMISNLQL